MLVRVEGGVARILAYADAQHPFLEQHCAGPWPGGDRRPAAVNSSNACVASGSQSANAPLVGPLRRGQGPRQKLRAHHAGSPQRGLVAPQNHIRNTKILRLRLGRTVSVERMGTTAAAKRASATVTAAVIVVMSSS